MKLIAILCAGVMLSGCSLTLGGTTLQGKDIIKAANGVKNLSKISKPGVEEEFTTAMKDIFDPSRGGGKWK